ncbi:LysR family transcriptional regulator [Sphingomonas sp.]|uniref:LysR family transcriptional regulator n=1 Tax=Sphingomonas sp. TaxID=28214 RepID=UPI003CC6D995
MLDLDAWAIFAAVADARSFTAAAEALGVSKATVSKAVARLETRLGQALFHRTSRRLALTEAGRPLADHARRIIAEAQAAEEAARAGADGLSGRIRLAAPLAFGIADVAPLVAAFLLAHPQVEIDLQLSDARVDIVADGFDLALRIADLPDSSLRARRLCGVAAYLVASPAYVAAHGAPAHPADLVRHRLLGYTNVPGPWRFSGPDGETSVRPTGPLVANSGDALLPALLAGLGIARLPDFILGAHLATGALVELLPAWRAAPIGLHLLTPPSSLRPARVEALIDWLATGLKP